MYCREIKRRSGRVSRTDLPRSVRHMAVATSFVIVLKAIGNVIGIASALDHRMDVPHSNDRAQWSEGKNHLSNWSEEFAQRAGFMRSRSNGPAGLTRKGVTCRDHLARLKIWRGGSSLFRKNEIERTDGITGPGNRISESSAPLPAGSSDASRALSSALLSAPAW
jgi:hypothetical protein